ncbi:hypothetical protein ATKI12_6619 [Kitasatospora sp. Ki12]
MSTKANGSPAWQSWKHGRGCSPHSAGGASTPDERLTRQTLITASSNPQVGAVTGSDAVG